MGLWSPNCETVSNSLSECHCRCLLEMCEQHWGQKALHFVSPLLCLCYILVGTKRGVTETWKHVSGHNRVKRWLQTLPAGWNQSVIRAKRDDPVGCLTAMQAHCQNAKKSDKQALFLFFFLKLGIFEGGTLVPRFNIDWKSVLLYVLGNMDWWKVFI